MIRSYSALIKCAFIIGLTVSGSIGAAIAGDVVKGEKVYKKCMACHMVGENAKNRVGPQLNGIIGRDVGDLEGYTYSSGMKEYAKTQAVWSEAALDAYLENPRKTVKGTRMSFAGLRKESDRVNVIAYLKQFGN